MSSQRGFTLIELLVVVVVVGILAAIGIPSYKDYVQRGKITEAISSLSDMGVKMEQYFQDNRTYVGACTAGTVAPTPTASTNFTYACSGLAADGYTVTATGIGSMAGFIYKISVATNAAPARSTTGLPSGWQGSGNTCWVIRKDGSC